MLPTARPARTDSRSRIARVATYLAGLAVLGTLLAGCVQAEIAVEVEDDGSGTATVLFAFDRTLLELLASLGDEAAEGEEFDPESVFNGVDRSRLPEGSTVEPYEEGDFVGARVTAPFERVEDVPTLLDTMTSSITLPGDEGTTEETDSGFERFVIERTDDGWRFDAVIEPASGAGEAGAGDATEDEFTSRFLEDASFTVKISLPGNLEEHNADEEDGGELTWNLDITSTEPRTLTARTSGGSDGGSGFPWALAAGGAGGAAVVLALAGSIWTIRRRQPSSASTGSEPGV